MELTKTGCLAGLPQPVDRPQTPAQVLKKILCRSRRQLADNTLICHCVNCLVLCLGHVAEVGEDHKSREEAGEAVDSGRDLKMRPE